MISSPKCVCFGATYPGSKSTRTWITSRPGTLRSWRWSSVRLLPGCCASADCRAEPAAAISVAAPRIRIVFIVLSQWPERFAQLRRKQLRIFPHREVTASIDLVEVAQCRERAPSPSLLRAQDFIREHRDRHRYLDLRGLLVARAGEVRSAILPVDPRRRGGGVGQPVQ